MKLKILAVFGTRPEAIKMAPLVEALRSDTAHFSTVVCTTGQHREMLDSVLTAFDIQTDYDLHVMRSGQDLYDVTAAVLLGMRSVLQQEEPDVVLVHGDTATSVAAAMAAFYHQVPVGHVEAGLRTYNVHSPWPEEMNRQLIGRMAAWHFAPTESCRDNLLREGVDARHIFVTGNTVIDALHSTVARLGICPQLADDRRSVLVTAHRRENFGEGLRHICQALQQLAERYTDVDFVYPVHPNPHVRAAVYGKFGTDCPRNLHFTDPADYPDFVTMMAKAAVVLTDSGGIQEEAPGLGKPVLVLRDTTERPEAVEAGTVKLVGTNAERIVAEVSRLLNDAEAYRQMSHAVNPYGDGKACERILSVLRKYHLECQK